MLPRQFRPVTARLSRAAVFTDFDGTVSPIVDDPARATAVPEARRALERLARRALIVMIVTGRPSAFVDHLGVPAVGQHGHEVGPPVEAVARAAEMFGGSGFPVELKSHMLTLHYRHEPARRSEAESLAARVAESTGLLTALAKMGIELRPSPAGKGQVIERVARGAAAAVYAGDDHGDLPAFTALRRLPVPTVAVAVMGAETPPELVREADVVCPSPYVWVRWLALLSSAAT